MLLLQFSERITTRRISTSMILCTRCLLIWRIFGTGHLYRLVARSARAYRLRNQGDIDLILGSATFRGLCFFILLITKARTLTTFVIFALSMIFRSDLLLPVLLLLCHCFWITVTPNVVFEYICLKIIPLHFDYQQIFKSLTIL